MPDVTQWLFGSDYFWFAWGFAAQALFAMRFVVQWIASEIRKTSYLPRSFWYFSIAGAFGLIIYAGIRRDPVFLVGQTLALAIYIRNIALMNRTRASEAATDVV